MASIPSSITMRHRQIETPDDVARNISDYALMLSWPKHMTDEIYLKDFINSFLTSPSTNKTIGLYSMMIPYPILFLHKGATSSEAGLLVMPEFENELPEGYYVGRLYVQLSNPSTRMDHLGKITTKIEPGDNLVVGMTDMSIVNRNYPRLYTRDFI